MRAAKGEGSAFKSGAGYRGYVTVNGKRKYFSAKTKAEAAQKKRLLLARRDDGRLVPGQAHTVAQWMNHWLDNVAKLRPTTYAMNKWVVEQRIIPELGALKLSALTAERIEQWLADLNVSASSQKRYLAPLHAALNVAAKRGHVGFNPAARVELEAQGKPDTSAFSDEDVDAILHAATGRNRARWHLALKLGLRPAEALGLTLPDIDVRARKLTIRHQLLRATGKGLYLQKAAKTTAGDREIILPKSLATLLRDHRKEQLELMAEHGEEWVGWEFDGQPVALVFPQENGRPIDAHMDTRAWHSLLAAAGLTEVRRYKARHTAASHLVVDSGGDVAVTAKILGHADSGFTYRTYVKPLAAREQALADKMDEPRAPYRAPYDPVTGSKADVRDDGETREYQS